MAWIALGCSAQSYSSRADRAALSLLGVRSRDVLATRESTVVYPDELPPEPEPAPESEADAERNEDGAFADPRANSEAFPEPLVIDLREALALAYASNRDMIDRKERLYLEALSLSGVRHEYNPQLGLALSYLFDDTPGVADSNSGGAAFSASQILPTGAILRLDASTTAAALEGDSGVYGSLVSLSLAQPLLRGGGYAVTHEPLIQAERNLVYAIRDFELFREDFSIDVARRYYSLVDQKQSIENQQSNLDNNEFGRRQAEALFAVGQSNELDVLRARRSELNARNALLEAEEDLQLALDNFRIFLGLPEEHRIDIGSDSPTFVPVTYDLRSAVAVAMENRLDLRNREEQLEDVERALRLSRNSLLPDLGLVVDTRYGTGDVDTFGGSDLDRTNTSLSLNLNVPLDRVRERNAYRAREIALERSRRDLQEFEDQLRVDIRRSFRELTRRLESLEINSQLIEDQTKNLRIAELRFERGELPNRDVVEANQSLLDAQNDLIDEQVSYEIARLGLLRDLGILFVDETGMWKQ